MGELPIGARHESSRRSSVTKLSASQASGAAKDSLVGGGRWSSQESHAGELGSVSPMLAADGEHG